MRPVSDRLLGVVQGAHTAKARATLVTGFPQSTTPTGTALTVLAGDVKMDSSAAVRSTIDCTVLAPWGAIRPDGSELFVEYGVEVAGGTTEWVALGYFGIQDVEQDGVNGPLRITGADRMARVMESETSWSYIAPEGTTHAAFFAKLLYGEATPTWFETDTGVFPNATAATTIVSDYTMSGETLPADLQLDKPFGELLQKVAADHNKRLFFDYKGRLNVADADVTAAAEDSVVTITAGAGGTLIGLNRKVTRDGVYNACRVEGEQPTTGDPPWGAAWNNTLYGIGREGAFGNVVKRFSSPVLTTPLACVAAAETIRDKIQGLDYSLSFSMVPNPGLETLDVVSVRFPGGGPDGITPRPGYAPATTEVHVIDSLQFPLGGGTMQVTTRGGWMVP